MPPSLNLPDKPPDFIEPALQDSGVHREACTQGGYVHPVYTRKAMYTPYIPGRHIGGILPTLGGI